MRLPPVSCQNRVLDCRERGSLPVTQGRRIRSRAIYYDQLRGTTMFFVLLNSMAEPIGGTLGTIASKASGAPDGVYHSNLLKTAEREGKNFVRRSEVVARKIANTASRDAKSGKLAKTKRRRLRRATTTPKRMVRTASAKKKVARRRRRKKQAGRQSIRPRQ